MITEQIRSLAAAGVDLIILETFGYLDELAEAVTAASEHLRSAHRRAGDLRRRRAHPGRRDAARGGHRARRAADRHARHQLHHRAAADAGRRGEPGPLFSAAGQRAAERRASRARSATAGSSSASTPPTSPATCAGSPRPGRPWSAGAAAPPRRTSRRRRRTWRICRCRAPRASARPRSPRPAPAGRAGAGGASTGTGILAARLAARDFVVAAGIPAPDGGAIPAETVTALRGQGLDLFTVTSPENPRAHRDSLGMAVQLQAQGGVETIVTMTTWDKTIMTLQADLLGAHALGIRSVICETGNPPVLGDYPAVDGIWEVDSPGLVALLAGPELRPGSRRTAADHQDVLLHRQPRQPGRAGRRCRARAGPGPRWRPGRISWSPGRCTSLARCGA